MRHNMMMDKLLQCPSDDGGVGWGVPSTFKGKRAAALFLQSPPPHHPCLGDIIKPHSFLLASASMSRLILNAQWWITRVMNSIRPATSEAVGDIEFLLTCKCFSSSGLRFLLTESKYGHAYFNGLLKPIFCDVLGYGGDGVLHSNSIIWTCWNLPGYSACIFFLSFFFFVDWNLSKSNYSNKTRFLY